MAPTNTAKTPSLSPAVLANLPPKAKALWDAHIASFAHPSHYSQTLSPYNGRHREELYLAANSDTFQAWRADDKASKNVFKDRNGKTLDREDLQKLTYTVEKIPSNPADGPTHVYPLYIAMHGGGATSTDENNGAWRHMMDWPGYVLVEKLVEYMILFHNVDPKRVYLVGFSAGGDGAFRIGSRLAQRFAACEIGGGDPGDVQPANFMNLPVCLQVGEQDEGWDEKYNPLGRCKHVAQFGNNLAALAKDNPGCYTHDVFIHPTGNYVVETDPQDGWKHNGWERGNFSNDNTAGKPTTIIQNYDVWLKQYEISRHQAVDNWAKHGIIHAEVKNTNTIDWLNKQKCRNPIPTKVMWDLGVGNVNLQATGENDKYWHTDNFRFVRPSDFHGLTQNYWLAIVTPPGTTYSVHKPGTSILGQLGKANNKVILAVKGETEEDLNFVIRVLLRPGMLRDLSQSISVEITTTLARPKDSTKKVTSKVLDVGPRGADSDRVIKDTLVRNDPNLVFTSDVILVKEVGGTAWSAAKYTIA